jgi:mono/diheme cytochrome c family protein
MRRFLGGFAAAVIVVPALALLLARLGLLPVAATGEPPAWAGRVARMAIGAGVARRARRVQNPVAITEHGLMDGMKIFQEDCAGCHGEPGRPSRWGTTSFYPRVPQFASDPPAKPDWQLFWIVKHGIRYSGMGAWDHLLPDDKIWQVATFLSRLGSLPPSVAEKWRREPSR